MSTKEVNLNIIEDELGNISGTIDSKLNQISAGLGEETLDYIENGLDYTLEIVNESEIGNTEIGNIIEDKVIEILTSIERNTGRYDKIKSQELHREIDSLLNQIRINR